MINANDLILMYKLHYLWFHLFTGLTSEEVFLGIDEVVSGLVNLNLTLPWLRHVPHPRVAGYDMKLRKQDTVSCQWQSTCLHSYDNAFTQLSFASVIWLKYDFSNILSKKSTEKPFFYIWLLLTASISASRRVLYCMLLVVSTCSSWPLMVGE